MKKPIRKRIKDAGLTQRQIAKLLGKYPQEIYDSLEGYNNTLLKKVIEIVESYENNRGLQ